MWVRFVIIEFFSSTARTHVFAQGDLYKAGPPILSSTFYEKVFLKFQIRKIAVLHTASLQPHEIYTLDL